MVRQFSILFLLSCFVMSSAAAQNYRWDIVYNSSPHVSFRGIAAVDDSICWVTGSSGTILRTTDGGTSWQHLSVPGTDTLDFRDVEALGKDTAVVMSIGSGSASRLYRTEDGGQSWNLVHQNKYETGFYDAITFWENGRGVLQGDPIEGRLFMMVTDDWGKTWEEIPRHQMPKISDGEYAFAASGTQLIATGQGHAWIGTGGSNARILHSPDFGRTWRSIPTPVIQGAPSAGIFSLAFDDKGYAIAVGGDYTKENEGEKNIIYSNDGGKNWQLRTGAQLDFRSAIQFIKGMFITVGPSGSEYSTDGGNTWKTIKGPGFHALSIGKKGEEVVWAAGRQGRVGILRLNE